MTLVSWWCIFLYVTGCLSHIYKHGSSWNGYTFHTYPHPGKNTVIPRDIMVDVINNLGLKLLAIHNEYNENNIAISPYGALSVLVALGEGLEGDAVYEIQQSAHIPNDISVIRVGLRDIHRHLKSYFIPKEGFLSGLTLNHENVTLRPEYEDILKFYGYDTVSFNSALFPDHETTERPQVTSSGHGVGSSENSENKNENTTEMGKAEPDIETTTEVMPSEIPTTGTTAGIMTTTEGNATPLVTDITTNEITTQPATTTEYLNISTTLPQTTVTQPVTIEPKTMNPTTATNIFTTTENAVMTTEMGTTTEEIFSEKSTTTKETTSTQQTTLPTETTQLSTKQETLVEETTTEQTRTTRDLPTTVVISTTESLTTSAITSELVTEDTTREFITTQNVLTTSTLETTENLPTTSFTTTQNIFTTTLSHSETTPITITPLPFPEFTTKDRDDKDLSTLPTTENNSFDKTTSLDVNFGSTTTNTPVYDINISTIASETESTTISLSTDNPLSPDDITFGTELTPVTDLTTDESTETFANDNSKANEIDTTDASVNDAGFGGAFKRRVRAGEVVEKLANVVELNIRKKEKRHDPLSSKRSSRSIVDYIIARSYDEHFIPHHRRRPYIPKEQPSFLIYGKYREYDINFMKYDTVLPFSFVPHLNAMALRFPLDSSKYYLLLLLPVDDMGIDQLICDLRLNGSLKYIISNLRYTHIIATIPSFMLKGYVTLTPSFQKLGIRKVFEPRQADFSPMTNQRQIYVTNIEQAITVTIRNYVDPDATNDYRNLHQYDPVHFKADHPFLYFVIDSDIHVTLMAGKIVNPINSRIS